MQVQRISENQTEETTNGFLFLEILQAVFHTSFLPVTCKVVFHTMVHYFGGSMAPKTI